MTGQDVVDWKKRVREEASATLARLDPRPDVVPVSEVPPAPAPVPVEV